jgi:hypothetical protein
MPKRRESAKAFRPTVAWSLLVLLSLATLCCGGSSGNGGTQWVGTFSQPDSFGGAYGTISFLLEPNNTVFCIQFSGTDSFPITDHVFSTPGVGGFTIYGQFTSPTQASGVIYWPPSADEIVPYLSWGASPK